MKKPIFPANVGKHQVVLKRYHQKQEGRNIVDGQISYMVIPKKMYDQRKHIGNTAEFRYEKVDDHEAEKRALDEQYATPAPTRNSLPVKVIFTEPTELEVVERSLPKETDIKKMTVLEMAQNGHDEEAINRELTRRKRAKDRAKKNAANKKKKTTKSGTKPLTEKK